MSDQRFTPPIAPVYWAVTHRVWDETINNQGAYRHTTRTTPIRCKTAHDACNSLGWPMSECTDFKPYDLMMVPHDANT